MGITHPTIVEFSKEIEDFQIDGGAPSTKASRVLDNGNPRQPIGPGQGANPGYGAEASGSEFAGAGAGLPMTGTSGGKIKKLNRTDFKIEFVWKPTPRAERELPEPEVAPDSEAPLEGGEQPTPVVQPATEE